MKTFQNTITLIIPKVGDEVIFSGQNATEHYKILEVRVCNSVGMCKEIHGIECSGFAYISGYGEECLFAGNTLKYGYVDKRSGKCYEKKQRPPTRWNVGGSR